MHYLFLPKNHLNTIRHWAKGRGAALTIDGESFALTIKQGGRTVEFLPRFSVQTEHGIAYTLHFPEKGGFIGWLPYSYKQWPLSSDKLAFKRLFSSQGLRVPALLGAEQARQTDFLIKSRKGSFGAQVKGPFNGALFDIASKPLDASEFIEQFVFGRAAKAWFWNDRPVALELIDPPYLWGNGRQSVAQLLSRTRGSMDREYKADHAEHMLAWQRLAADTVPAEGQRVWLGFKYTTPYDRLSLTDREVWGRCGDSLRQQVMEAGSVAYNSIPEPVRKGCLFTLDAVVDAEDRAWWLEMNSNPMVHPRSYTEMLMDLFETPQ